MYNLLLLVRWEQMCDSIFGIFGFAEFLTRSIHYGIKNKLIYKALSTSVFKTCWQILGRIYISETVMVR